MTTNRVVRKQLATQQDLLFGSGKATQTRNGAAYELDKITIIYPVVDSAELNALDTALFQYAMLDTVIYVWNNVAVAWEIQTTASKIPFVPYSLLLATNVQAALEELEDDKADITHEHDADYVAKDSDTGAANLPVGTTAQRPAGAAGLTRLNTETGLFEGHNGSNWGSLGGGATGNGGNQIFVQNDQNVTGDYTVPADKNAMSTGPITIDSGVTVTIDTGARWVVI